MSIIKICFRLQFIMVCWTFCSISNDDKMSKVLKSDCPMSEKSGTLIEVLNCILTLLTVSLLCFNFGVSRILYAIVPPDIPNAFGVMHYHLFSF